MNAIDVSTIGIDPIREGLIAAQMARAYLGTWATFATWPGCGTASTLPTIDVNAIHVPTIGIDPMRRV